MKNKIFKFHSGTELEIENNDLTAIIETLYEEIALKSNMNYSFNEMKNEIDHLISQMSEKEIITILSESLFLNTITYENQMMENLLKKMKK